MSRLTPLYIVFSLILLAWLLYDKYQVRDELAEQDESTPNFSIVDNVVPLDSSEVLAQSNSLNQQSAIVSENSAKSTGSTLVDVDALFELFISSPEAFQVIGERLRALVAGLIQRGDYLNAVKVLYEMRLFVEVGQLDAYDAFVFEQVGEIEAQLKVRQQTPQLIELYQELLSLHPERAPYALSLARWQLSAGLLDDAEQSLSWAVNDYASQAQVEDLRRQIDEARVFGTVNQRVIPLVRVGSQFLISVELSGIDFDLLIDTGASKTVVKRALVPSDSEDWRDVQSVVVNTANSQTRGRVMEISNLRVGGIELGRSRVIALELDQFRYDGLLGMDVLSQFDFSTRSRKR